MAAEVGLEILEGGPETDALLRDLAVRLGFERLTPDEYGYLPVPFLEAAITGEEAWERVWAALYATSAKWSGRVNLLPLGVVSGPRILISSVRDTGPTDNSGDDTLYVVKLRARDGAPETFRFWVAQGQGQPSEQEVAELVAAWAGCLPWDRGVVEQFREFEKPHGRDRLAVRLDRPE